MGERFVVSIFFPPLLLLMVMIVPCGLALLLDGLDDLPEMIKVFLVLWFSVSLASLLSWEKRG